MSEELKACSYCGKQPQGNNWHTYGRNPKDEMRYFCANHDCPNGFHKVLTLEEWNTRPIEDALRAELAAKDAEIERLQTWLDEAQSACKGLGQTADNFGARLNAARAEVERLRAIIQKVEWVGYKDFEHQRHYTCAFCGIKVGNNHSEYCPFYQWEGGAQ